MSKIPAIVPGFYFIYQLVSDLSLWVADHLDKLRHLLLLAGGELTDPTQDLHDLRLGRWRRGKFLSGQYQTVRQHPHVNRRAGIKPRRPSTPRRAMAQRCPIADVAHGICLILVRGVAAPHLIIFAAGSRAVMSTCCRRRSPGHPTGK